jgi:hypothetical protein
MEITTRNTRARAFVDQARRGWTIGASPGWAVFRDEIRDLDRERPDLAEVVDAAHRKGWPGRTLPGPTVSVCDECRTEADPMVRLDIGGEYDHDLCADCLRAALGLL